MIPLTLGECYDSGHANLQDNDFSHLDGLKDRLIAVHLHDNDGTGDQHKIPFDGTVDWQALCKVIAASDYKNMVNLELQFSRGGYNNEKDFLQQAYQAGEKLTTMIEANRTVS